MDGPLAPTVSAYRPFGAFRLALALLVVLQHLQYLLPAPLRTPFDRLGLGALAVGVFFALSGFIVAEACDTIYAGRPAAFLLNRLLRVVPPYLAAMALSAATQAVLWRTGRLALWDFTLHRDPLDPALLAAGVASLLPGFHTSYVAEDFEYIPFVWTLRVEMAFYLAATAVAAASALAPRAHAPALAPVRARALSPVLAPMLAPVLAPSLTRVLAPVLAATPALAVAAGFAAFAACLATGGHGILTDVPFFLLGACLHAALRTPTPARVGATLLACACALAAFPQWNQRGHPDLALQLPALALLLAATAALAARPRIPPAWRRLDRRLGALSYPLYLNHYAVGIALYDTLPQRTPALYAAGLALSLALAWLMHRLVETPLDRLRTRVRGTTV